MVSLKWLTRLTQLGHPRGTAEVADNAFNACPQAANASLARLTQLTLLEASRALLPMPEVGAMPGCAQLRIAASVKVVACTAIAPHTQQPV